MPRNRPSHYEDPAKGPGATKRKRAKPKKMKKGKKMPKNPK